MSIRGRKQNRKQTSIAKFAHRRKVMKEKRAPFFWSMTEAVTTRYLPIFLPFLAIFSVVTAFSAGLLFKIPVSFQSFLGAGFVAEQMAVLAMFLVLITIIARLYQIVSWGSVDGSTWGAKASRILTFTLLSVIAINWYVGISGFLVFLGTFLPFAVFVVMSVLYFEVFDGSENPPSENYWSRQFKHIKNTILSKKPLSYSKYRVQGLVIIALIAALAAGLARVDYLKTNGPAKVLLTDNDEIEVHIISGRTEGVLVFDEIAGFQFFFSNQINRIRAH